MVARAVLGCGYAPSPHAPHPANALPPLRFSRDRRDIAYLYRPNIDRPSTNRPSTDHSSARPGNIPATLTAALVNQWANLSPATPPKTVGAGSPCPTTPQRGNPDLAVASPHPASLNPDSLTFANWETYLSTHTTAQALPSGQLLLRPTATALGTWLWAFAHICPPPPSFTDTFTIPFPQKHPPLAEALHLSPLALLQYTHRRCHQLAHRSPVFPLTPPDTTDAALTDWLATLAPSQPTGLGVLRALVMLVDDLAAYPLIPDPLAHAAILPAPILNQGFMKGYRLCEAVDLWLRDIVGQSGNPATVLLLRGVSLGLAHLLQGWLQATAPTQL